MRNVRRSAVIAGAIGIALAGLVGIGAGFTAFAMAESD